LNKQQQTNDKGWSSSLGVRCGAKDSSRKKSFFYGNSNRASDLDGFFGQTTKATEYGYEIQVMERKEFV
jgi:hypothetical protein